jgi:enoyl-CoA hydratase/carnithine racemase
MDCRVPVLIGVHNAVVGGGIDLMSMCDIRYSTEDAYYWVYLAN